MPAVSPMLNDNILTGIEWDEGVGTVALLETDPSELPALAVDPLVGAAISIDDDILVVDLPVRYLEPCARALIHSLEDEGHYNERYHHTIIDPDGAGGLGVRVDIVDTPESRAAVSRWLAEQVFDRSVAFGGGFEPVSDGPVLRH